MLPKWFRWIVKKKYLTWIVEEAYQMTRKYIKNKLSNNRRTAQDLALTVVGQTIHEAINLSHQGDNNLCNNEQLKDLNIKAENKVNSVWGDLKYKTDFRDTKELMAELGFKRSF